MRSDVIKELVQIIDDNSTTIVAFLQLMLAFKEAMEVLGLVHAFKVVEQIIVVNRDDILETKQCWVEVVSTDDDNLFVD